MNYKINLRKKLYPLWFLLPFLIMISMFFGFPIILTGVMTFTDFDITYRPSFVGFKNYQKIAMDPNFFKILAITFTFTLVALAIIMLMSIVISILTQYFVKRKVARYAYRTIWLSMNALPSIIYAVVIRGVFSPYATSGANYICLKLGLIADPISWLNHFPLVLVIFTTGFLNGANGIIILSAAINSIPEDYYKAARVDGTTEWGIVTQVIIPLLKWPLMYLTVTNAISLISSYNYILLLTEGGPNLRTTTLSLYAYQNAFENSQFGYGAAISIFVVTISIALVLVLFKLFNFDEMIQPCRIDD
jgi:inositol-phosphate transport system permease protein